MSKTAVNTPDQLFKAGSGVQAFEIYEASHAMGKVVVGGEGRVRKSDPSAEILLTRSRLWA
jgi:hypothetical protein